MTEIDNEAENIKTRRSDIGIALQQQLYLCSSSLFTDSKVVPSRGVFGMNSFCSSLLEGLNTFFCGLLGGLGCFRNSPASIVPLAEYSDLTNIYITKYFFSLRDIRPFDKSPCRGFPPHLNILCGNHPCTNNTNHPYCSPFRYSERS